MMITRQDVFNAAWQKFVIEKAPPAVEKEGMTGKYQCKYLTVVGRKCAIGLCIPDGHPAQHLNASVDVMKSKYPDLHIATEMNNNLQRILHDNLVNLYTGEWIDDLNIEKQYREIATTHHLTIPGE